jgi:hypothetical protein
LVSKIININNTDFTTHLLIGETNIFIIIISS